MVPENRIGKVLFDGRFLNKPSFGISRDALACLNAFDYVGALGGVLSFKNTSMNSASYLNLKTIQLSQTYKQLAIQSLLNKSVLIDDNLKTKVFFQSQVDVVKYQFTYPHRRIVRIHDLFPITNPEWFTRKSIYSFKKGLSNIADFSIIIANSHSTHENFQNIVNCEQRKLSVFTVPCDAEITKSALCSYCSFCKAKNQFNYSYLLSVGTIEPRKNHKNLLDAWSKAKNQRSYEKLIIVGRVGWKATETVKKIQQSEGVIHFADCCDGGLLELYKNSKAFISASFDEGFDIPLKEASMLGLRLLMSDIAVHREKFSRDKGLWFQPNSVENLTLALQVDPETIGIEVDKSDNFQRLFLDSIREALDVT